MNKTEVIESIRQVASTVLPQGSKLYLYGSRARGDAHEDSDWDLLLLLDKPQKESTDFNKYAYPIMARGFDMWQYSSRGDLYGCDTYLDMNVRVEYVG